MTCKNPALARGLCCKHYWRTKAIVDKGGTTWEKQVANGAAKAPTMGRAGKLARQAIPFTSIRACVSSLDKAVHSKPKSAPTKLCLVPGCDKEAATRGLCGRDYAIANSLVKKGDTTWKKLVGAGKAEASYHEIPHVQRAKDFFLGK